MELIKIINARNTLDSFSTRENIGAHLSYWMTKFVISTQDEHDFYTKELRKLFDAYANKKDDDSYEIPNENLSAFNAEVKKLSETDVKTPNIKFKLSELAAELKLSMQQMYTLLDFVDEEN